MRIAGSGMGVTTLKLVGITANNATAYAVGLQFDATDTGIAGFELTDMTIDANLGGTENSGTGITAGAIRVRGTHIYARRLKFIGYGTKAASSAMVCATIAGKNSQNCIFDSCTANGPSSAHASSSTATIYGFQGTESNPHEFCVVRNCAARGAATFDPPPAIPTNIIGIAPGVGFGTVLEGNQFANLGTGVALIDIATKDLVMFNNHFRNVHKGVSYDNDGSVIAGRVIAMDNIVELARTVAAPHWF